MYAQCFLVYCFGMYEMCSAFFLFFSKVNKWRSGYNKQNKMCDVQDSIYFYIIFDSSCKDFPLTLFATKFDNLRQI